jgi:ABC-type multidrug transport system ATPase subunit
MSDDVVRIEGLRKCFGAVVAVDGMDLSVPRGALFGLLGPNGAGKSTTFGICCGWLLPTAGHATLLGVRSNELHRLCGRVAALPQDAWFPRQVSVRAELTHFARLGGLRGEAAHREADRVLGLVELSEAAHQRGGELSHGMLKRVGLAQALIGSPELIFLDEPTAGLDPASARKMKDLIAGLAPKTTVVLSSHNLAEVQEICTHGAILDRGKLLVKGTIDDLTRKGAEITIDYRAGANIPREALERAFGAAHVAIDPALIRVSFANDRDVAEVIGVTLGILLEAKVPVLGVQRGTSLETAFLELTRSDRPR